MAEESKEKYASSMTLGQVGLIHTQPFDCSFIRKGDEKESSKNYTVTFTFRDFDAFVDAAIKHAVVAVQNRIRKEKLEPHEISTYDYGVRAARKSKEEILANATPEEIAGSMKTPAQMEAVMKFFQEKLAAMQAAQNSAPENKGDEIVSEPKEPVKITVPKKTVREKR